MASFKASTVIFFVVFCICCGMPKGDPDTTWISGWCSDMKFAPLGMYSDKIRKTIGVLRDNTAASHFYQYSDLAWYDNNHIYGRAACSGKISPGDCSACLQKAAESLKNGNCFRSIGAQVKLKDCRMRYEPTYFDDE